MALRLLHVSDLHFDGGLRPSLGGPFRTGVLPNKRFVGLVNLKLRRARYYANAEAKVAALGRLIARENIDAVLCSGDYTALGTAEELRFARQVIEPLTKAPQGLVTVPGNHDVYLDDALGVFEEEFAPFLRSDLPELQESKGSANGSPWPLVRLFDEVAVVCVNSARPNPPIFRSSGRIPDVQMEGLRAALAHPEVKRRTVFVMTHYAPRLVSGNPDTPHHGLENADALLSACNGITRGAIIHGHVHKCYQVQVPECSMPLFSAGSTTQEGHEGLWVYEVGQNQEGALAAYRGRYADGEYTLEGTPEHRWG